MQVATSNAMPHARFNLVVMDVLPVHRLKQTDYLLDERPLYIYAWFYVEIFLVTPRPSTFTTRRIVCVMLTSCGSIVSCFPSGAVNGFVEGQSSG
jgi:hypothetical protein